MSTPQEHLPDPWVAGAKAKGLPDPWAEKGTTKAHARLPDPWVQQMQQDWSGPWSDFNTRFKEKFGFDLVVKDNPRHHRASLEGNARDISIKNLTDQHAQWILDKAPKFGLLVRDFRSPQAWKAIGGTGPHLHVQAGKQQPRPQAVDVSQTGGLQRAGLTAYHPRPTPPTEGTIKHIARTAFETVGLPTGFLDRKLLSRENLTDLANVASATTMDPVGTAKGWYHMLREQGRELKAGYDQWVSEGSPDTPSYEVTKHVLAGAVPMFGQQAKQGLEKLEQKDYVGAGTVAAVILAEVFGPKAAMKGLQVKPGLPVEEVVDTGLTKEGVRLRPMEQMIREQASGATTTLGTGKRTAIATGAGAAKAGFKPVNPNDPAMELSRTMGKIKKGQFGPTDSKMAKPSAVARAGQTVAEAQQQATAAAQTATSTIGRMWQRYRSAGPPPHVTAAEQNFMQTTGEASLAARQLGKSITDAFPDAAKRDAIYRYAAAGGDRTVLQDWASRSTNPIFKQGYENALRLTRAEQIAAEEFTDTFKPLWQEGHDAGVIGTFVEDYISRTVKKGPPGSKVAKTQAMADMKANYQSRLIDPNFKHARGRVFPDLFSGEKAGFTYDTDFGRQITGYYESLRRAIASRQYLKDLTQVRAADGRPLAAPEGMAFRPTSTPDQTLFIKSGATPEAMAGYKPIDHWAFKGWKWVAKDPVTGEDVFYHGDLKIHPDHFAATKARFAPSAIRQYAAGRVILNAQANAKGVLFSMSPFHMVQEATHGLFHTVNPFSHLPELNPELPAVQEALRGGLQLGGSAGSEMFAEGLAAGHGIAGRIPIFRQYQTWLFHDYIPKLKLKTYQHILDRNLGQYSNKLSRDQIVSLSADQANAAFGELNYFKMARSKTVQDLTRLAFTAPDFFEARARFVGQALKPYGREQLRALMVNGSTLFITARILNALENNGDSKWKTHPFSVVANGKEYRIRTVVGDLHHLITDPKNFFEFRLNPATIVPIVEQISGREFLGGGPRAYPKTLAKKEAERVVPIPLQGLTKPDRDLIQSLLESSGLQYRTLESIEKGEKAKAAAESEMQRTAEREAGKPKAVHVGGMGGMRMKIKGKAVAR